MSQSLLTLNELFTNSFRNHGEKTALHFGSQKMTYRELHRAANQVAHALIEHGVERNTRVALLLSNSLEYVASELGIYFSGGTLVPMNDMLSEKDIYHILKDSGAKVLLVGEQFFSNIEHIKSDLPELTTIVGITNSEKTTSTNFITWDDFQSSQPDHDIDISITPENNSKIIYSGGTSGLPKGVVDSHKTTFLTYISMMDEVNIREDEKILLMTPLPHAAGLYLMAGLVRGAEVFIESKFDTKLLLEHIEKNKITFLSLVPTMIYRVLDFMEGKNVDVSSIRTIQYGTAPITVGRLRQALDIFGQVFIQAYGQQETQNVVTWLKKEDHRTDEEYSHLLSSCGKSTFFSRIKIVDGNGCEVSRGVKGEIAVKSLTNMIRYHNMPIETAETLKDGWVYTGDMGVMDEKGYLYLLDRKKDMIISGGMNVYSSEVENVIQEHHGVRQVAVIGIPDSDWGEAVTAFIIPKNESVTVEDIQEYCNQTLSKYKKPKVIHLVESLPLTPYGKVDKKVIRAPYWDSAVRQI
ncbi:AMP-binding protein [Virgibacillus sp. C22-A2]|uniref:AMP-binding protein n=1 Tax=Virgibacillus tibetensis TaxID=3042313 RepID=A0ABU6KI24_9BACI|nr:AMP-binding protein [Virgibacillus sp. C22-A2]